MRKGKHTNSELTALIEQLREKYFKENVNLWNRLAKDLAKPTRSRRVVNLTRLNKVVKDGETIVVPGKVLGGGEIDKKINVAAFSFSDSAREKIIKANGSCSSINDMMQQSIKGKKVRIIG